MSSSERPISVAMIEKMSAARGVKRLMHTARSTKIVAMSVDAIRLFRSSFALPVSSTFTFSS